MLSIYWRFWWSFTWRTYLILFSVLGLSYLFLAYASDVPTALQIVNPLMFVLGPFVQVYVLKKIFRNEKFSFDARIVDKISQSNDRVQPWNPR